MMKVRAGLFEALEKQLVQARQVFARVEICYRDTARQDVLGHLRVLNSE